MRPMANISYAPVWAELNRVYHHEGLNETLVHYYIRSLSVMTLKGELDSNVGDTFLLAINQLKNHFGDPQKDTISIYLGFSRVNPEVNTHLLKMMNILNKFHASHKEIIIYWSVVADEELIELGLDFKAFCEFKFELVDV